MQEREQLGSILKEFNLSRVQLAEALGMSKSTIDNWCAGRTPIQPRQLQSLFDALTEHGVPAARLREFVVNELETQGLQEESYRGRRYDASRRPKVFVLAWDLTDTSVYGPIYRACIETLERLGYSCILLDCAGSHSRKRYYVRQAISAGCRGLVSVGLSGDLPDPEGEFQSLVTELTREHIRVVAIRPWIKAPALPKMARATGWNARTVFELGIGHLRSFGHQKIGTVASSAGVLYSEFLQMVQEVTRKQGLEFTEDQVAWAPRDVYQEGQFHRLLSGVTGVYVSRPALSTLVRACYRLGLTWPEDISIVTVGGGQHVRQLGSRPFTYVNLPAEEIGRHTAYTLVQMADPDCRWERGSEAGWPDIVDAEIRLENAEGGSVGPCHERALVE